MQLTLLAEDAQGNIDRDRKIERNGDRLEIPETIDTIDFTHGLHRFPGKFIPQVPRYLLRYSRQGRRILDPFCGSGTTLIEAAVCGHECIGCDIDPLSVLITRAKVRPLVTAQLLDLQTRLKDIDWQHGCDELIPPISNLNHWFSDEAVTQLSALKKNCCELEEPSRSFALAVFSSIIRRVSNADDQTQKTYVSHTKKKTSPEPKQLFPVFLQRALVGMSKYANAVRGSALATIRLHDSRHSLVGFEFDDVITSPPYIDSIDYAYNQMLEYFWLLPELGLHSRADFNDLRKRPIGMTTARVDFPHPVGTEVPALVDVCERIASVSPKESRVIKTFFYDYARHIRNLVQVQKPGALYAVVIASSLIRGYQIPTPEALIAIHESYSYQLIDRFTYGIKRHYMKFPRRKNSSKIIEDSVLVFKLAA